MVSPLDIATQGYLCSPLSVATDGYICIDVEVDKPVIKKPGGSGGGRSKTTYKQPYKIPEKVSEEDYNIYLKRKEEEEVLLFIKIFAQICL